MSNSSLIDHVHISPHSTNPRQDKIKKITIHHMAGNLSVETCGNVFDGSREVSSNYGIDSKGRVGMYVEEKNRSWCSSSRANDNQAVTIEVANSKTGGDWPVSDKALAKLIELCTDICKRNGIKELKFTGNANGNLTLHKYFASTSCPGPYLEGKMKYIASEVNKRLTPKETTQKPSNKAGISVGDIVSFKGGKHYSSAVSTRGYAVSASKARVTAVSKGSKHPVHLRAVNKSGAYVSGGVYGWVDLSTIDGNPTIASKTPKLTELEVGDIVSFTGTTHYASTNATKGSSVKPCKAKVTAKYPSGKHQVHLRAVNDSGAYIGGVYGWVNLSDIKV